MNQTLIDRLRGFQIPPAVSLSQEAYLVAWLQGIDFEGLLRSPDFDFGYPFDGRFGKMMMRTASHLLGGDACGRYGYTDQFGLAVLLDNRGLAANWDDAGELQSYLVALASSKMSLEVEDEALFCGKLYAFPQPDLALAFLVWRQQETAFRALDSYCRHVLAESGQDPATVDAIMEGLKQVEKEEILRQHQVEYNGLPAWQRYGAAVYLQDGHSKVQVETELPRDGDYGPYLRRFLG